MPAESAQRQVGGLWCGEVLALLPDLVDGALAEDRLAQLRTHVAGCTWCERFGGDYGALVAGLRRQAPPEPLPDEVARRLAARLALALD